MQKGVTRNNLPFTLRRLAHVGVETIAAVIGELHRHLVGRNAVLSVLVRVWLTVGPVEEVRWGTVQPGVACEGREK